MPPAARAKHLAATAPAAAAAEPPQAPAHAASPSSAVPLAVLLQGHPTASPARSLPPLQDAHSLPVSSPSDLRDTSLATALGGSPAGSGSRRPAVLLGRRSPRPSKSPSASSQGSWSAPGFGFGPDHSAATSPSGSHPATSSPPVAASSSSVEDKLLAHNGTATSGFPSAAAVVSTMAGSTSADSAVAKAAVVEPSVGVGEGSDDTWAGGADDEDAVGGIMAAGGYYTPPGLQVPLAPAEAADAAGQDAVADAMQLRSIAPRDEAGSEPDDVYADEFDDDDDDNFDGDGDGSAVDSQVGGVSVFKQASRVFVGSSDADEANGGAGLVTLPPADGDDVDAMSSASSVVSDLAAVLEETATGAAIAGSASAVGTPETRFGPASTAAGDLSPKTPKAESGDSADHETFDEAGPGAEHHPDDVAEWEEEDVADFLQHQLGVADAVVTRVAATRTGGAQLLSLTDEALRQRLGLQEDDADWAAVRSARLRLLRV